MQSSPPPLPPPLKPKWLSVNRFELLRLKARVYLLKNIQTNDLKGFDISAFERRDKLLAGLGTSIAEVIEFFISSGLVRRLEFPSDLPVVAMSHARVADLKKILRLNGLPLSGKKAELAKRCVSKIPDSLVDLVGSGAHYLLTDEAIRLINECDYREEQAHKYVLACIERRDYKEASSARALLNAISPLPVGAGCDWLNWTQENESRDVEILDYIYHSEFPCSIGWEDEALWLAKKLAALFYLYGSSLPSVHLEALRLLPSTEASQSILATAWSMQLLACFNITTQRYLNDGLRHGRWAAAHDQRTCSICIARHGNIYSLSEVMTPCHEGCRCSLSGVYLDDLGNFSCQLESELWDKSRDSMITMHAERHSISFDQSRDLLNKMASVKTQWELLKSSGPLVVERSPLDF